ncbi:probable galacturonosyltransferase 14 [Lactuca sativa]|uniref:probable galacturonosyltransferase 14 n=1 Tax=Lactuca sativa TaxID=4236 RepID=UPI0022AF6B99|nr:probable galacturonosyltransferase 14 [Lactuca sativa]
MMMMVGGGGFRRTSSLSDASVAVSETTSFSDMLRSNNNSNNNHLIRKPPSPDLEGAAEGHNSKTVVVVVVGKRKAKRGEKARMQVEAKAAEDARRRVEEEATAEAKRKRDLERESTRQALLKEEGAHSLRGSVSSYRVSLMLITCMERSEREIRESKLQELINKHFAASSVPKGIHCLSLRLTDEYSSNAHARRQLPSPEFLPVLSDNSYYHFILSTDNIFAAIVVVTSTVQSSLTPEKIVFHVITDKKTYAGMHSWFALNPISPAIIEVKGVHQFDWLTRDNVPVLEAVENHNGIRNYYHGNHISDTNVGDTVTPRSFAS